MWSAPNYCYRCGNVASVLEISEDLHHSFNVFGPAPDHERKPVYSDEEDKCVPHYFL